MQETYSDSWGTDFASIFKQLQSKERIGAVIGNVVNTSPLTIEILDGEVLINAEVHDVFVSSSLLGTYGRDMVGSGNISFSDSNCGTTTSDGGCSTAAPHTHDIAVLNVGTTYNFTGEITNTDSIKNGDVVLVLPDEDHSAFFIISKLIKVGDV